MIIFTHPQNMNKKINGGDYFGELFDSLQKHCELRVANDPNLVIGNDIESGLPFVETKEERQAFLDMWESLMPKDLPSNKNMGKIIVFGTGGQMDGKNDFSKLWKKL